MRNRGDVDEMFSIPVIYRYLTKELFAAWLAVTVVLYLVLMSNQIIQLLNSVAQGAFSAQLVIPLIALISLSFLPVILSFTFFLAILFILGRFSRDLELTAIFSCGISPRHFYRGVLFLALPIILMLTLLTLWLSPWAEKRADEMRLAAEQTGPLAMLEPGRFATIDGGRLTVYISGLNESRTRAHGIFVYYQDEELDVIITAEEASFVRQSSSAPSYIEFYQGHRYEGEAGEKAWRIAEFERHGLKLNVPPLERQMDEPKMLTLKELLDAPSPTHWAEVQWRISLPLMVLILVFLALPLGHAPPRSAGYGRLIIGFLIYLFYLNGLFLVQKWVGDERLPVWIGVWPIHLGLFLLALFLYQQHYSSRTRRWRLKSRRQP